MCGRFSLTTEEQRLNEFFRLAGGSASYVPRYNGAPTQNLAVITAKEPHVTILQVGIGSIMDQRNSQKYTGNQRPC